MKKFYSFTLLLIFCSLSGFSQIENDTTRKYPTYWLSGEELLRAHEIGKDFIATPPPTGEIINIAEFQPMQGVIISWPLGISVNLVKEMANVVKVTTLVSSTSAENSARTSFTNGGVNMANVEFLLAATNTHWTRDYSPWFIIDGNNKMQIIDFIYNRPRPNDNAIPAKMAAHLGVDYFTLPIQHTGGNYMTDGYGISASTTLTLTENNTLTQQQIKDICKEYLGLDDYYFLIDPMNDYIEHIDCWAKLLAPDKIMMAQVPTSDSRYANYEAQVQIVENLRTPWGTKYRIYRVFTPGNDNTASAVTPYTNSLILNDRVFLPIGGNSHDAAAIAKYQEAMPGYTIVPITASSARWYMTDALHCRTHEVADLGMLFVRHYPLFDTVVYKDTLLLRADIRPLSGQPLVSDSLLVFYKINEEDIWQTSTLLQTEGTIYEAQLIDLPEKSKISYYIFAKDESQRREKHPYIGSFDPHFFFTSEKVIDTIPQDTVPDDSIYIHQYNLQDITLFPIPIINELNIAQTTQSILQIEVFDALGRKVIAINKPAQGKSISLSLLTQGIYLVKITTNKGVITKKIVKR